MISAKAVVLATGGAGRVFEPSTNALICTGDGLSLAMQVGVPLMDTEMIQYHPTTLAGNGILLSEAARGDGAYLINSARGDVIDNDALIEALRTPARVVRSLARPQCCLKCH